MARGFSQIVSLFLFGLFQGIFFYIRLLLASCSIFKLALQAQKTIWFMTTGFTLSQLLYHPHFLLLCVINSSLPVTNARSFTTLLSLTTLGLSLNHPFQGDMRQELNTLDQTIKWWGRKLWRWLWKHSKSWGSM